MDLSGIIQREKQKNWEKKFQSFWEKAKKTKITHQHFDPIIFSK